MIVTINLSTPRKKIKDKINSAIFEAKMKNVNMTKHRSIVIGALLILMLKGTNANAEEILTSTKISSQIVNGLNLIGYPTVDVIFNLLQMKKHFKYIT
jgi:hypothetical protein